jgi:hypothetical protein
MNFKISRLLRIAVKWLRLDLNLRPWAYESPALTTELRSLADPSNFTMIITLA